MMDLKARLMENPGGRVHVGFSSEEFNELPLIREHQVTWMNKITSTSRPVELLLFADDTTSLCRQSYLQQYKEMMK